MMGPMARRSSRSLIAVARLPPRVDPDIRQTEEVPGLGCSRVVPLLLGNHLRVAVKRDSPSWAADRDSLRRSVGQDILS